jgi:predicted sulfurtransferase
MASNLKEMLAAADAVVPRLTAAEFRNRIGKDDVLVVDLRDGPELAVGGKIKGAVHASRGMLEFRADPDSPYYTTRRIAKRCIDANLSTRG